MANKHVERHSSSVIRKMLTKLREDPSTHPPALANITKTDQTRSVKGRGHKGSQGAAVKDNSTAALQGRSWPSLIKVSVYSPRHLVIPNSYRREMKTQNYIDTCMQTSVTVPTWKQLICPSTGEQTN